MAAILPQLRPAGVFLDHAADEAALFADALSPSAAAAAGSMRRLREAPGLAPAGQRLASNKALATSFLSAMRLGLDALTVAGYEDDDNDFEDEDDEEDDDGSGYGYYRPAYSQYHVPGTPQVATAAMAPPMSVSPAAAPWLLLQRPSQISTPRMIDDDDLIFPIEL